LKLDGQSAFEYKENFKAIWFPHWQAELLSQQLEMGFSQLTTTHSNLK
jgi:hypothetical protein